MAAESSDREAVGRVVQEALRKGPFGLRDVAEEMGGSYGTLREWSRGARIPTDESVERIATALETRARKLTQLAERMRREVERRSNRSR